MAIGPWSTAHKSPRQKLIGDLNRFEHLVITASEDWIFRTPAVGDLLIRTYHSLIGAYHYHQFLTGSRGLGRSSVTVAQR